LDAGGVGACGGFGQAEGAQDFAGGEAFEITILLIRGAEGEKGDLDGGVGDAQGGGDGGVDFGNFFKHEDVGNRVQAGTTPFFGHEHATAAQGAEFLDYVEGKVVGAFPVFDVRANFGGHEFADGVADEELVVGEGEVHREESLA